ncbi:MAG: carboxypeptidase-like regulatory domain-containing protein [Hymenobacter sp.]
MTVLVEGTSVGSSTNADGTYTIGGVPAGPHTLVVSFIGYTTARVPVTVGAGQTATVPVQALGENATALSEAVVIGYGTQRRQDLTGAVEQIDSKQFVKGQVTNPEQLIQGNGSGRADYDRRRRARGGLPDSDSRRLVAVGLQPAADYH